MPACVCVRAEKSHFAELAVDAVLRLKGSTNLDSIQIIKKAGGTIKVCALCCTCALWEVVVGGGGGGVGGVQDTARAVACLPLVQRCRHRSQLARLLRRLASQRHTAPGHLFE